jgi:hypothetical protein
MLLMPRNLRNPLEEIRATMVEEVRMEVVAVAVAATEEEAVMMKSEEEAAAVVMIIVAAVQAEIII